MKTTTVILCIVICIFACKLERIKIGDSEIQISTIQKALDQDYNDEIKTIHILVALCDNKYQGIIPVPKSIGNGQDPKSNLYWGAAYGIKTYFKKSKDWNLISTKGESGNILESVIFKHADKDIYILADAYDGQHIKETTEDFLKFSSGQNKGVIELNGKNIGVGGNAKLIAYIGHDGLMDFQIKDTFENVDGKQRDVIILACYSKRYFETHLQDANVNPLVWTTGLMAPEAYTLHDAIAGYIEEESNEEIKNRAAKAYASYQKCSLKAASRLLITH